MNYLSRNASKNLNKEELIKLGYRVEDSMVKTVVEKIFAFADKEFFKALKKENYSIEDFFDDEKAPKITRFFLQFFNLKMSAYTLLSNKDTLSFPFISNFKNDIEKIIKPYLISDDLTEKELKKLDKVFAVYLYNSGKLLSYSNISSEVSFFNFKTSLKKTVNEMKLIAKSRFNSFDYLRSNNQLSIDYDIYERAKNDYLTDEFRYSFYENLVQEWEKHCHYREEIVRAINSFEENEFHNNKIIFI